MSTSSRGQSASLTLSTVGSASRRSACSGLTVRNASSGRREKSSATHEPIASPVRIALGSSATRTLTGRKSPTTEGSRNCVATPMPTPSAAPSSPMATDCTT